VATTVAHLQAVLSANTRDFDRAMGRSESKMSKFGAVAKGAALGAGVAVAYGLGKVAKIGWDEFNQGQKVAAQTNAVLKSTGGVANVTAKQVEELGDQIMRKTGIDDEQIKAGQNMLLTFKNVRNEMGKGNDIFTQATKLTTDFAVATGTDMVQANVMVGKALNDPIRGLTALTKKGVTFTEQQREQVKRLVESGQTMKAQKIILRELATEYEGSAEAVGKTLGGQINILRERFNNWAGDMVAKAIPMLQRFGEWLNRSVIPAAKDIGEVVKKNWPAIKEALQTWFRLMQKLGPVFRILIKIGGLLFTAYVKYITGIIRLIVKVVEVGNRWVQWLRGTLWPTVQRVFNQIRDHVNARLERVRAVFALVRATAMFTWNFIRDRAQTVIDKVAAIIRKLKEFVEYVKSIPGRIKSALGSVGGFFGKILDKAPGGGWGDRLTVGPMSGGLGAITALAARAGLSVTSGYRPGDPGWHGKNRARDYAGTASSMVEFARNMAAAFGPRLLELIHTPLGFGVKNGQRVSNAFWGSRVLADHYDHVHVAMNSGGIVPGPRGAPVPVLAHGGETFIPTHRGGGLPMVVNVQLGNRTLASALIDLNEQFRRKNGRGMLG
jgi:hypothetical protein